MDKLHEKRRQVTFRITEVAQERLEQAAGLFNMLPAQYAKAVLYKDLGVFSEPLDERRLKAARTESALRSKAGRTRRQATTWTEENGR